MRSPMRHEFTPRQRLVGLILLPPAVFGGSVLLSSCSSSSSSAVAASSPATTSPNKTPTSPAESPSATVTPEKGYAAFTQAQSLLGSYGHRCTKVNAVSSTTSPDNYGHPVTTREYTYGGVDLTCQTTMAPTATSPSAIEQVTVTEPNGSGFRLSATLDGNGNIATIYATKFSNGSDGQTQTFVEITASGLGEVMRADPNGQPELFGGDASDFVGEVYNGLAERLPDISTSAYTNPASFVIAFAAA